MLADSHCHLDELPDPDAAVAAARAAGVERIVAVAQDLRSMQAVLRLRDRHPRTVLAALGIHPQRIPAMTEAELGAAFGFLERHLPEAAELGEVGLDHKWATSADEQDRQRRWLDRQLELAAACGKPINLHSRRALRATMEIAIAFQERHGLPAQLHWFTQSRKLVRLANEAGVMVSVGPSILDDERALAVACTVADDCLLLETDAPVPFGGESAQPSWIPRVRDRLASARGIEPAALASTVAANLARLLAGRLGSRQA